MNILNFFRKRQADITFVDTFELGAWKHYPIKLAKDFKPLKDHQIKQFNNYAFPECPGMHDYGRMGYIMPSWSKFSFKANKAGCIAHAGGARGTKYDQPKPMDVKIADGTFTYFDGIPPNVWNLPSPWKVIGSPGLSAIVLPAIFHNKKLSDGLFIYPGVVDYYEFNPLNVICSIRRGGEFTIEENEPLLQIIPIKIGDGITAEYGLANKEEVTGTSPGKYFNTDNFYRKFLMSKKKFTLNYRKNNE
jgi:hypothetical protein